MGGFLLGPGSLPAEHPWPLFTLPVLGAGFPLLARYAGPALIRALFLLAAVFLTRAPGRAVRAGGAAGRDPARRGGRRRPPDRAGSSGICTTAPRRNRWPWA
ncbi:hypothetical protein TPA0598_04_00320 [Streptomyces lydicamycinicus]|uniref:Uncharacterized protein n=1 Tax=Streptomyces lydicamycinicus TaxID=1546107 RepID=A0A0P4R777_9ACTN|nr:hypothetical protein TPA0598_04_00320 [Streptomyces lydicamycinicus]